MGGERDEERKDGHTEIVRHDDHPTLKLLDRTRKRINRLHIQMIRRLI